MNTNFSTFFDHEIVAVFKHIKIERRLFINMNAIFIVINIYVKICCLRLGCVFRLCEMMCFNCVMISR